MLIAAFIWGTTFVAQTTGMETIGPFAFTTARYLIGAIALLPLAYIEQRKIDLRMHLHNDRYLFYQTIGLGVMMFGGIALQQTALLYTGCQWPSDSTLCRYQFFCSFFCGNQLLTV